MSDLKVNPATIEFLKQEQARRRKRRAVASVAGLALVAGIAVAGYFGYARYSERKAADSLKQLAAEIKPGDRDGWEKMREAVDSGQVTREQARDAMRAAREAEWQKTMDGYFKTPVKERDKYLDKLIDDQMKRMAEWQRDRPTTGPTTRPERRDRDERGPATRPTDAQREARGRERADNQSPLQRAQQSEFRAAMEARMKERGIQAPRGGPGGGGGRGGGRRG